MLAGLNTLAVRPDNSYIRCVEPHRVRLKSYGFSDRIEGLALRSIGVQSLINDIDFEALLGDKIK